MNLKTILCSGTFLDLNNFIPSSFSRFIYRIQVLVVRRVGNYLIIIFYNPLIDDQEGVAKLFWDIGLIFLFRIYSLLGAVTSIHSFQLNKQ
jgi:hypothetical protein